MFQSSGHSCWGFLTFYTFSGFLLLEKVLSDFSNINMSSWYINKTFVSNKPQGNLFLKKLFCMHIILPLVKVESKWGGCAYIFLHEELNTVQILNA